MQIIDPERIDEGMHVVLSRRAAKKHNTQRRRVAEVTRVDRKANLETGDIDIAYFVAILEPRRPECTCIDSKKHRFNRTTLEQIDIDKYGESRAGFTKPESPKVLKLKRDDFWKMQEFPESS